MKKSWHPQTLKNIERVWKAEQRHEAEQKKIEELQKQLKDERAREEITRFAQDTGTLKKKDDRLDWMYQGPAGQISRDEYLLGRPIDKQIMQQYEEPESGPSAETGLLPGSIFNSDTAVNSLDMAAKIREDPLFEIRKREEEKKKSVLTNPVKMREIRKMLRENLEKEKKKKKKKEKKEKREEKDRRREKKHRRRSSSSEDEERKHSSKQENMTNSHSHHRPGYGLQLPSSRTNQVSDHRRDRSRSPLTSREEKRNRSPHEADRQNHAKAPSPTRTRDRYRRPQTTNYSKRLSADELEKRRREMLGFAQEREEEREKNVKRYKHQDEQEKERERANKHNGHASFIHNMKLESVASSSVEDRVKRNIHSIQRTSASLEKNFMRR